MSKPHPRILIIGAGIGGLALAQGLRRRNIDFAVFERDAQLESRLQGYRVKMFSEMKEKLRGLLLDAAFSEFKTTCAQTRLGETNLNATDAAILACRKGHLPAGASLPYTVDRGLLRRAMMTGFRMPCTLVFLADGSVEQGTLLIGTDGSRSAVRKQFLPEHRFLDTYSCCIYGKSFLDEDSKKRFPPKHREWITVVRDSCPLIHSIITHRSSRDGLPHGYIRWGLLFPKESCGLFGEDALNEALRSDPSGLALEITSQWHPSIRSLLELQDTSLTAEMRVYSASPDIGTWESSPHVTLLGDAIHLMSPSGGVGAVAALNDTAVLAQIIADKKGIPSIEAIGKFEQMMKGFAGACLRRMFVAGEKMLNAPPAERCKSVAL